MCMYVYINYITIYKKIIFQKVSFCVLTNLIGQNNRATCKRLGLSWKCIQCHEAHIQCIVPCAWAGWANHGHQTRASRTSIESTFEQSENIVLASWATEQ